MSPLALQLWDKIHIRQCGAVKSPIIAFSAIVPKRSVVSVAPFHADFQKPTESAETQKQNREQPNGDFNSDTNLRRCYHGQNTAKSDARIPMLFKILNHKIISPAYQARACSCLWWCRSWRNIKHCELTQCRCGCSWPWNYPHRISCSGRKINYPFCDVLTVQG